MHGDLHSMRFITDLCNAFKNEFKFGNVRCFFIDFLFVFHADVSELFLLHFGFEKKLLSVFLKVFVCFVHYFLIEVLEVYNIEFFADQVRT